MNIDFLSHSTSLLGLRLCCLVTTKAKKEKESPNIDSQSAKISTISLFHSFPCSIFQSQTGSFRTSVESAAAALGPSGALSAVVLSS